MDIQLRVAEAFSVLHSSLFPPKGEPFRGHFPHERLNDRPNDQSGPASADDRIERHGKEVARNHVLRKRRRGGRLLDKLAHNERELDACYRALSESALPSAWEGLNTPAGELLLDNHWMVEEQVDIVRRHVSYSSFKKLPQLGGGRNDGLPRVWDIAQEHLAHCDGPLDCEKLNRFVAAYQSVTPLTLRELWALPVMVRLALIEKLRRVAICVHAAWQDRKKAAGWADRLMESSAGGRKALLPVVAELAAANPPLSPPFTAELARRLQGQGAVLNIPLNWAEEVLSESSSSIDAMVRLDLRLQAAAQVSIQQSLDGLGKLAGINWPECIEGLSLVERTLRGDPSGIYGRMTFASRERYRGEVERLARKFSLTEERVSRIAVGLAEEKAGPGAGLGQDYLDPAQVDPASHVGLYLVGKGRAALNGRLVLEKLSLPVSLPERGAALTDHKGGRAFISFAALLAVSVVFAAPFFMALASGGLGIWQAILAGVPLLLVTSQWAVGLVNWLRAIACPVTFVPRMDYSNGVPDRARTLAVIPAVIRNREDVGNLLERLEVHYLANRDPNLQFGLLTDFADAPGEILDGDATLLTLAERGVKALNRKYPGRNGDLFFLCQRPRRWSASEHIWKAWENRRGSLAEFQDLLRGEGADNYQLIVGNTLSTSGERGEGREEPAPVRYVITLDAASQLPRDAALQLIASMEHPLNRPILDSENGRLLSGYARMQPRVAPTLVSVGRSAFSRLFNGESGAASHARGMASFIRNPFRRQDCAEAAIYAVEAFAMAPGARYGEDGFPAPDLLGACRMGSGLADDVVLFEPFPVTYEEHVRRWRLETADHWRSLPWLFLRTEPPGEGKGGIILSLDARWEILDALRQSLVPLALVSALVLGWLFAPNAILWTLALVSFPVALALLDIIPAALRKGQDVPWKLHGDDLLRSLGRRLLRIALLSVWLPFEALYRMGAALGCFRRGGAGRSGMSRRSGERNDQAGAGISPWRYYRLMLLQPLFSLLTGIGLLMLSVRDPMAWAVALPMLLLWAAGPALAWRISRSAATGTFQPSPEQEHRLGMLARRTWTFFDSLAVQENNWLPPDTYQEKPAPLSSRQTGPAAMGLSLLAHLSACDFGWLSADSLLDRLDKSLTVMSGLERYRHHFFARYSVKSLEPLEPKTVASAESGCLAGYLMILSAGLREIAERPLFHPRQFQGLADTAAVLSEVWRIAPEGKAEWERFSLLLQAARNASFSDLHTAAKCMRGLLEQAEKLERAGHAEPGSEAAFWLKKLVEQCRDLCFELESFAMPPDMLKYMVAASGQSSLAMPNCRRLTEMDIDILPLPLRQDAETIRKRAARRFAAARRLSRLAEALSAMDFGFLFDKDRNLLSREYSLHEKKRIGGHHEFLASEARFAYYVTIAQGRLPQKSWFALRRPVSHGDGEPALLSWSGALSEYLLPMLVSPCYKDTLLEESCNSAIKRQAAYGRRLRLPWGVTESGCNIRDASNTYQYRSFGVPGLGVRRGLGDDFVVAPHASIMALMFAPAEAMSNLAALESQGLRSRYGMYDAVDYTPGRLPAGARSAVVFSHAARHQGMSLLALASVLLGQPMQRRFLAQPEFESARFLLEERLPEAEQDHAQANRDVYLRHSDTLPHVRENMIRVIKDPDIPQPAVQMLTNGHYHVMVSSAGGGYSRLDDTALTRWRSDTTRDNHGSFIYLRDVGSGEFWSAAHQPVCRKVERYGAFFCEGKVEFKTLHRDYHSHVEIAVSPEQNLEVRRLTLLNQGSERRTIEITSYAEIVLSSVLADLQHPASSGLFVESVIDRKGRAVICRRRSGAPHDRELHLVHLLSMPGVEPQGLSYETDRSRFMGRGRDLSFPAAMDAERTELEGTDGLAIDPIAAIRCRLTLDPGQNASVVFVTGIGRDREHIQHFTSQFQDAHAADQVFDMAWTHSQVLLHQFGASVADAQLYEQMASSLLYPGSAMRASVSLLAANGHTQSGIRGPYTWGDNPIAVLRIHDPGRDEMVREMVKAHAYWSAKGLPTDLVIVYDELSGSRKSLHDMELSVFHTGAEAQLFDRPGGIFLRSTEQLSQEDALLLLASARLVVSDRNGSLREQVYRRRARPFLPENSNCPPEYSGPGCGEDAEPESRKSPLFLGNRYGGFTPDGNEYVITLQDGETLPAPWVNVIANQTLGTVISESGSAYTWFENAHEFRLTPWHNDPVQDACGEAMYLRDEETGRFWSPTPLPARGKGCYSARHGFGYSVFCHIEDGIRTELTVFVPMDASVKLSLLKVYNISGRERRISVTGYVEWALGDVRDRTAMHIVTEKEPLAGAVFARNAQSTDHARAVAFFAVNRPEASVTGDRAEFLGRNGSLRDPAAMRRVCLSGRTGPGLDPCAGIRTESVLKDGECRESTFILGGAENGKEAVRLVRRFTEQKKAQTAIRAVIEHWKVLLGAVRVKTPDPAVDVLVNGWLIYQTVVCHFMARSGYYQSGGAYGFRDQLEDAMAMAHSAPGLARQHLLRCAARQYTEGDVQHWWHPPHGRGVRSRSSDDCLWLPLAVERYVSVTGDTGILREEVRYLDGRPLNIDEAMYHDVPVSTGDGEPLLRHCVRALERGLALGERGLPLMGGGDWSGAMDTVGNRGKGESVWLGFFLHLALTRFAPLAEAEGEDIFAERCREAAETLRHSLERHGWDGAWYRRAYFDDGTPLGSALNEECRIDSSAQSWAVLSGACTEERGKEAMQALYDHLVHRESGLVQLLAPPFDTSALSPGTIKSYVPGVRENGGQFTRAAVWAAMAFASLGDAGKAWQLLRMLNPILRGVDDESVNIYKVEPYVASDDVLAAPPHEGRGGWTWYSGSAGWMFRLMLESLLGLSVQGDRLRLKPLLPAEWEGFTLRYRFHATKYHIAVKLVKDGEETLTLLDGHVQKDGDIRMLNDGLDHRIDISCPARTTVRGSVPGSG